MELYCKKCGRKLSENAKFCPTCGDIISKNAQPTHNYSVPNPNQVNNFNVPNHNYNAPNPNPVSAPKPMPKSSEKKSSNKGLLIGIVSLLTLIAVLLSVVIFMLIGLKNLGKDDSKEPKSQTVELTQYNFYEYFTYEVTDVKYPMSNPYSNPYGEIVVTFYPLKNFEIENGQFDISIKSTDSSISVSIDAYRTITQKIPFDGKFSITFNNWVEFDYWFKAANNENITVNLSNVSGTITLK